MKAKFHSDPVEAGILRSQFENIGRLNNLRILNLEIRE